MTRAEAKAVLDATRDGKPVGAEVVTQALQATGDVTPLAVAELSADPYAGHLERMVEGYAQLALAPGAREYVWERVNALARGDMLPTATEPSAAMIAAFAGVYADLPARVAARVKEIRGKEKS